ncbi:hypothetical protein OUZ56_024041 [Daphnia magna]|uniref:Uncharacterized protein n=1 Tax=Daphnia magna TaxID=35525 RepID=A0ABR0AZZ8_9CRUS|nr:hypothetical protein OUZ56_024041 [Daphnia magna]
MAQDGIDLVFEKPHSNIFPTMDQSHCKLDGKPIESLKSLDSHVKFVEGYLRDYCAMKISNGIMVVKGLVHWVDL